MKSEPTPGAMQAAREVIQKIEDHFSGEELRVASIKGRFDAGLAFVIELASIIDEETAAPELLAALEMLDKAFQQSEHREIHGQEMWGDQKVRDIVHTAIAKAKGE